MKLLNGLINTNPRPTMHRQEDLIHDLKNHSFIGNDLMVQWFEESYSTSKHLLALYSLARGLDAKTILEIGFGRSSFVLAKAAKENRGSFITCDRKDFSYLLSKEEKTVTRFVLGDSDKVWRDKEIIKKGIDFAFLDYFSNEEISLEFCLKELGECYELTKTNGVIAIHDSFVNKYNIGQSISEISKHLKVEYVTLPYNYGLGLLRKTGKSKYGGLSDSFLKK